MKTNKRPYQVNDYILDFLVAQGIKEVFVITGGAIAFVMDAFYGRSDIKYIPTTHEQGAAMMAEAYSRLGPGLSACMVTSGPGATNLITGMCCAWFDSIPALYITGQVNTYEQRGGMPGTANSRQIGFQETDIVNMVKPITKYAKMITKVEDIRYEFEKAVYIAKSGRPGPVVLDLPMDLQRIPFAPKKMKGFAVPITLPYRDSGTKLAKKVAETWKMLAQAERPVLVSGGGVRLASAVPEIQKLAGLLKCPVITSWSGFDSFPWSHPQLIGSHGVYGSRGANYSVQNCDTLLTVGSRLDTRQTGGRPNMYARAAKLIMVDIDRGELAKRRGLTPKLEIECDAKVFLNEMIKQYPKYKKLLPDTSAWMNKAISWKIKYPSVLPEFYKVKNYVDPYVFGVTLSELLPKDAVIIPDEGGHLTWIMQSFRLKEGQRLFSAFGNSPMGYAFPAAIGASIARGRKDVICIDGDGGFQFNVQEMQTMVAQKIPVKIFIMNNDGFGIIRQFQTAYIESHLVATTKESGVTNPDFKKIALSYGVPYIRINNHGELKAKIKKALKTKGPVLIELMLNPGQEIIPKLVFGKPLEDQWPNLPASELAENMMISAVPADPTLTESN